MRQRVITVAAAVIVDDRNRLLVVRKHGTTAFLQPGGKVDPGETALEAVMRELVEEIGVAVSPAQVRSLGCFAAEAANEPDHVVEAELFAVDQVGEPRPLAEIEEIRWIDPDAPGEVELAPLTEHIVLELVKDRALR